MEAAAVDHYSIEYTRQRDWFDPSKSTAHVTCVGVGGIGSPTALALAKLGIPKLTLIDPDTVEPHNIPNQMFVVAQTDMSKVDAIADQVHVINPRCNVEARCMEIGERGWWDDDGGEHVDYRLRDIVISGLDSMQARADLWKDLKGNVHVPLYLDARLGGEHIVIYAVQPHNPVDIEYYEEQLHPSEEAMRAPCTRQSVIDVGFSVSALLVRHVRLHLSGSDVPRMTYLDMASLKLYTEAR